MILQNKRLTVILFTVAILLLIPLVSMQFTDRVDWSLYDFIIMGLLLLGKGLQCELVLRKVKTTGRRLAIVIAILFVFFLIWAEVALGIFGMPFTGS